MVLRDELKELKASLKSKDCEVQNLQESRSKKCERNKALELELNAAKVKIDKHKTEKICNLWDNLDSLEQFLEKTVWKCMASQKKRTSLQKRRSTQSTVR